jgi:hypothetical protein
MAQRIINVGVVPNDGSGDLVRDGMIKVNDNFTEIYTSYTISSNVTVGNTTGNVSINSAIIRIANTINNIEIGPTLINIGRADILANNTIGLPGQVLTSSGVTGIGTYWSDAGVNTSAQYAWTNTHTFSGIVNFNSNAILLSGVNGTNGYVITSNGSALYWGPGAGVVNVDATYAWTNTHSFSSNVTYTANVSFSNVTSLTANSSTGTNGQVLTSNGTTVYWNNILGSITPLPLDATSIVDFGDSVTTAFTLPFTIVDPNSSIVTLDGLLQIPNVDYTISGTTLTFVAPPVLGTRIEFRDFEVSGVTYTSEVFAGTGVQDIFTLVNAPTVITDMIVTVDGLVQIPTVNYTISGTTLQFAVAPLNGTVIEARNINFPSINSTSESFVATGTQTTYITSTQTTDAFNTIATVDGLIQIPGQNYTSSGTSLIFFPAPVAGSTIEFRNFTSTPTISTVGILTQYNTSSYIADGFTITYPVTLGATSDNVLVFLDGLCQIPGIDYSIINTSLIFISPPYAGTKIQIRELPR